MSWVRKIADWVARCLLALVVLICGFVVFWAASPTSLRQDITFTALAQVGCVPNPNLAGPPSLVNGCPLTAAMLNMINLSGVDPRLYGADPTGVADSTSAINTAIGNSSTVPVLFTCGTYKVTGTITISKNNLGFGGPPGGCVYLSTNQATGDVLVVSGTYNVIHDIQFTASVTRTAGNYINLTGSHNRVRHFVLNAPFYGITMAAVDSFIDRGWIFNTVATTGRGIYVTGASPNTEQHIGVMYFLASGTQPQADIYVDNAGDLSLDGGSEILNGGTCLLAAPGTGQSVTSLTATGPVYFDSCTTRAMDFCPTGSGVIQRSRFVDAWASNSGQGIRTCAGVTGLEFFNTHILINTGGDGIDLTGGSQIEFLGGECAQNNGYCASVSAGVSQWSIDHMRIGAVAGLTTNVSGGIIVAAGSSDNYTMVHNIFVSQSSAISDAGTGIHKTVFGNPGDQNDYSIYRDASTGFLFLSGKQSSFSGYKFLTNDGTAGLSLNNDGSLTPKVFVVGSLPTCNSGNKGATFEVSDANAPTYGSTLSGSGSVPALAVCDGVSAWKAH